ncbi:hypothetical protein THIAE_02770 [Thiomicrospira aerophila AL3]|uniref:Uncharacterized protein n=1 Tax=Thiomicrospira aerophila AL3 TaxID=717772 RepID=W0DY79_9GAMM|nr:hypothetical protein THIAE_02770 [Thiomicrospira aerophila AL3]
MADWLKLAAINDARQQSGQGLRIFKQLELHNKP